MQSLVPDGILAKLTNEDCMKFPTKATVVKTTAIAGAVALVLTAGATAAQAQDIIKIGHVAATSGPIAHLGKDNENGARMAVDELNAKGVVCLLYTSPSPRDS